MLPLLILTAGCLTAIAPAPAPQPDPEPIPVPVVMEPEFIAVPAVRTPDASLPPSLADIDCRMPAGHQYRDSNQVTWSHETTHGVNAEIRNRWMRDHEGTWNGFYVLGGKGVVIREPNTTIAEAARLVPQSLRREVYDLYMVQMRLGGAPPAEYRGSGPYTGWNDRPLYVWDEATAYINGSITSLEATPEYEGEIVRAVQMSLYGLCVPWAAESDDPQLKAYLAWQWDRLLALTKQRPSARVDEALRLFRESPDAQGLRDFCRGYFGADWTQTRFGF